MSPRAQRAPGGAALALLGAALLLSAGCEGVRQGRTAHDDWRDTCAAAARAHLMAADQAAKGELTPAAFALDDAFDAIAADCRRSLERGTNEQLAG